MCTFEEICAQNQTKNKHRFNAWFVQRKNQAIAIDLHCSLRDYGAQWPWHFVQKLNSVHNYLTNFSGCFFSAICWNIKNFDKLQNEWPKIHFHLFCSLHIVWFDVMAPPLDLNQAKEREWKKAHVQDTDPMPIFGIFTVIEGSAARRVNEQQQRQKK